MVEMFVAVFIVINADGEEIGDMRSPDPMTKEECEMRLASERPRLAAVMQSHGLRMKLPGTCEPVGEPI